MVARPRLNGSELLPVLLEHGADVNAKTTNGETALQELAMSGTLGDIRLVLERGAEVNAATEAGETALHWAALNGLVDTVKLLLEYKADVNMRTIDGETALSWATKEGHRAVVDLLLEHRTLETPMDGTITPIEGEKSLPGTTGVRQACGKKWAILIGINTYLENLSEPVRYGNLRGCVNDILLAESYLRQTGVEENNIRKLFTDQEDGHSLPTYHNITKELANISNRAASGDLVYIHYSGHAAVRTTAFPALKGPNGLDGTLVPMDAQCGGQFLTDLEIAYHLNNMVKKGLLVTLVLDCQSPFGVEVATGGSHENSLMQGTSICFDAKTGRLVGGSDFTTDNGSSLSLEEFLEPRGYTFLAAAPSKRDPQERRQEGGKVYGIFTYTLFQKVLKARIPLSNETVHRRLRAKMNKDGHPNPVILGDRRGSFFDFR